MNLNAKFKFMLLAVKVGVEVSKKNCNNIFKNTLTILFATVFWKSIYSVYSE